MDIFICPSQPRKEPVCKHPDALPGEVWLTNKSGEDVAEEVDRLKLLKWHPRVGKTALNSRGEPVEGFVPIFIDSTARFPDIQHVCDGYCGHPHKEIDHPAGMAD